MVRLRACVLLLLALLPAAGAAGHGAAPAGAPALLAALERLETAALVEGGVRPLEAQPQRAGAGPLEGRSAAVAGTPGPAQPFNRAGAHGGDPAVARSSAGPPAWPVVRANPPPQHS